MYAVIKTGGKQYTVRKNDRLVVEKLDGKAGDKVTLSDVLMLGDGKKATVGAPLVKDASVSAEILDQGRGDKIKVFKKKRRQNYRRTRGHRQPQTTLRITNIQASAKKSAAHKDAPKEASEGA